MVSGNGRESLRGEPAGQTRVAAGGVDDQIGEQALAVEQHCGDVAGFENRLRRAHVIDRADVGELGDPAAQVLFEKRAGLAQRCEARFPYTRHPVAEDVEARAAVVEAARAVANEFVELAGEEAVEGAGAAGEQNVNMSALQGRLRGARGAVGRTVFSRIVTRSKWFARARAASNPATPAPSAIPCSRCARLRSKSMRLLHRHLNILALALLTVTLGFSQNTPAAANQNKQGKGGGKGNAFAGIDWNKPFPAHKIVGNVYFVGSEQLGSFLITSPEGHILINSDYEETVPVIRAAKWRSWASSSRTSRSC